MRLTTAITRSLFTAAIAVAAASSAAAQTGERPSGAREGIKVHGHWVIEVKNTDGSVATRKEFENELALPGDEPYAGVGNRILAALLSRNASAGLWEIQLHGVNVELCFNSTSPQPFGCIITEPAATNVGSNYFRNLTITPDLVAGTVTLRGSARVQTGTPGILRLAITHVTTAMRTCSAGTTPAAPCTVNQSGGNFTKTEVPGPQPTVVFDQTIDVTVTLSFS